MRTLIIDNHDSFTHNLVHLVGSLTGVDPVVVRNDEPVGDLAGFDRVVISPGPGRPERARDFGVCADVIRRSPVPVLGVCLGHQGICHVYGGTVGPAPEVRHGLLSDVRHDGTGLFAGVPSPFPVVRYHSLAVTRVSDVLETLAVADDGVVMAVRHRELPRWGVQFHPESVLTTHGERVLGNFLGRHGTVVAGRRTTVDRRPVVPHRRVELDVDAEAVFDALHRDAEWAFWLDSADGGRFSFLGDASGPRARVATADVSAGTVTVRSGSGDRVVHTPFLDWVDGDLRAHRASSAGLPFDFALGWIGYLGYELKGECGAVNAHRSERPDATMIFADRAVVVDHAEHAVYLLSLEPDDEWFDRTEATLRGLTPPGEAEVTPEVGTLRARHGRAAYLDLVAECQREITEGETYEVCLTNQLTADGKLDPWQGYRVLRRRNPEPFCALLRLGERSVLSASPERFLRVSSAGVAESRPIKGTRPRGATPAADERLRAELATSRKDRAENLMIVDLVRNDLGRVAEPGSVTVDELFAVETHPTVHQLVSTVRARLRPDRGAVDCVRAAFPGGSMTGAPKARTMEIIDRLEGGPRGVYSGALGYFSRCGAADFGMVIRTLVVEPDRVSYGVGGAVIALSDPDGEVAETAVKAAPLLRLLDQEFPA
ncbi:aminodeoxychorismate synthase component I [Actinophytocola gossypii]|uniref:aminodeoxychorismate synthase n=1 Tax=Actinophytocola gossypii TaxID=2812003 RepID=A0ABT2J5E7_9PSEU|nr:aminodeoxychorismate synthase component I [Actinophytocola gossypii]MCT2582991.1 aminodeoxychorismate synthase component I [Actinophytocola gossypii]